MSGQRKDVFKIFDSVTMPFAFLYSGIQVVFSESLKDFSDMFSVFGWRIRIDQNVVNIDKNTDVKEIRKDIIYKSLKRGGSVGKTKGHDCPFKGTILGSEDSLPFLTFVDSN
jgi:hypothetical protein